MKISFKHIIPVLGAAVMLTSCDENAWNDKLDGFEQPDINLTTDIVEYTLTSADYAKVVKDNMTLLNARYTDHNDPQFKADSTAIAAVGTNHTFVSEEQARELIPAFLRDSTFEYFALSNGSDIRVTYNLTTNLPATVAGINNHNTPQYRVTEADYKAAWGSETDYINGFAPDCPAATSISAILLDAYPDAEEGDYVYVNYNYSSVNPIFGSVSGGEEEEGFTGGQYYMVANGNKCAGPLPGKNYGYLAAVDVTVSGSTVDADAVNIFTFTPTQGGFTIQDSEGRYVYQSGTYNSFNFSDTAVEGSTWTVTIDSEGNASIVNATVEKTIQYDPTYNSWGSYADMRGVLPVLYKAGSKAGAPRRYAPVQTVAPEAQAGIFVLQDGRWTTPAATIVVQPADYKAMGANSDLSGTRPDEVLPAYLSQKYPFASDGDTYTVVYRYYASSTTTVVAREYTYNAGTWAPNFGSTTDKFTRKGGFWNYNPSVELVLPYSRNTDPSYTTYMACVNWVFNNISKPDYGSTDLSAAAFIDYRGNAEFYSGASAYYGNVDVRAVTAKNNAPDGYTGYDGLSDDEITALVKKRFCLETMRGALSMLYPEAAPVAGMDVTYTIHFTAYTGSPEDVTLVYEVSGPAQFKYKSCTWYENGEDEGWE